VRPAGPLDAVREDVDAGAGDPQRVQPGHEVRAAQLLHLHAAQPDDAVGRDLRPQPDDAVHGQPDRSLAFEFRRLEDEQRRAAVAVQEVDEREHLLAELVLVGREVAQLRDRINHDAPRAVALDGLVDALPHRDVFDLARREDVVLARVCRARLGGGREVNEFEAVEPPAEARDVTFDLVARLGQRDVQPRLAVPPRVAQPLEREDRFAGPRAADQQVAALRDQPPVQHFVKPGDAGRHTLIYHAPSSASVSRSPTLNMIARVAQAPVCVTAPRPYSSALL
jgi:hypothetical protein